MTTRGLASSIVLVSSLLLASCGSGEPEVDSCADDVIGDWESVDEFPCPAVDPSCMYRHTLNLDGSGFEWVPDTTYEGSYTCEADMLEAIDVDGNPAFTATYDATADSLALSWGGQTSPVAYRRTSP